ncbi:MAG: hypothetical protein HY720_09180 [Planctomycetes bacterium]|nr:hypothetical protein [Planctomycetota bacterium]
MKRRGISLLAIALSGLLSGCGSNGGALVGGSSELTLISNKDHSKWWIDGVPAGEARTLKVSVSDAPHKIRCEPEGYVAKEEMVQPPYDPRHPLRFTFMLGEANLAKMGIEPEDVARITDKMMVSLLAAPAVAGRSEAPRVIIDSEYFRNESQSALNTAMFADSLRAELTRVASNRLVFVGREYVEATEMERELKREGVVDEGTTGSAARTLGADFRLGGRVTSIEAGPAGARGAYFLIVFELVDMESGEIVWTDKYEVKKGVFRED